MKFGDNDRMRGRVALVTGAGGLIGAATALRFAAEGATLVLTDISERKLQATAAAIRSTSSATTITLHRCGITEAAEIAGLAAKVPEAGVDILVNIVGGLKGSELYCPIGDLSEERWDQTFELNLKGIFHLVRAFAPGMKTRGRGSIVNISSIAFAGDAEQPDYAAAKAAVVSLTRSLAIEYAPEVTVNCIAPGLITADVTKLPPGMAERYLSRTLLKRTGHPDEIAAAIAFLAGPDASYITGALLPVSGGIWPNL